jgi:hypothetical protein
MAYGHAERTLATICLLEAETRELLASREHLDPEQAEWLRDTAESAARLHTADPAVPSGQFAPGLPRPLPLRNVFMTMRLRMP